MKSIKVAWAIAYPNKRFMLGWLIPELYSTKQQAQDAVERANIKGKPVKVRITVEKVI